MKAQFNEGFISQAELKELFSYCTKSGEFKRLKNAGSRGEIGAIAGTVRTDGYRLIQVNKKLYMAHRLAWFYTRGVWPAKSIDHINGVKDDNRIENLREATHSQNMRNTAIRSTNTSGFKGVTWCIAAKKWQAQCTINYKAIYLGLFETAELANSAYQAFAKASHGEFYPSQLKELACQQ